MVQPAFDLESVIKRRGFIWPSFEVYGGSAGLYDYGPLGTALRNNIVSLWRRRFVLREGFTEIDTPNLTPEEVFQASGHLEKFNDVMLECSACASLYKADTLFSEFYPAMGSELVIDALNPAELGSLIREESIVCPECRKPFKPPYAFNLMFRTTIGRDKTAYLHPETAQGIFVNFQNLYGFHREKLPLGTAQVGKGFRNELSPRQGVIRLREFNMAEAEVFMDPEVGDYPGFDEIRDEAMTLLDQLGAVHYLTAGEAVGEGVVSGKALAYFLVRTREYLLEIGIDPERLRFRQHRRDEMAHYAEDCWDAEILMELQGKENWIECVGIANRSCYDIERHMEASGEDLRAFRRYPQPVEREVERIRPDLPSIGRTFRKDAQSVRDHLLSLEPPFPGKIELEIDGTLREVTPDMFTIERRIEKVSGEWFVPSVIEPSFGIDRILYAVLQHSYDVGKAREGVDSESYVILRLNPFVAPVKVGVFPLFNRSGMPEIARGIHGSLLEIGVESSYDDAGSIGKRYARMDEIGTPYCITVDHQTVDDSTVTIRERDSTAQERIPVPRIPEIVKSLISGALSFGQVKHG